MIIKTLRSDLLTSCDREPIHTPGAILPHGAMMVLDPDTLVVLQAAGDTAGLLGSPVEAMIGEPASAYFSQPQLDYIGRLLRSSTLARPRHLLDPICRVIPDRPTDASVHRNAAGLIFEFEAADTSDEIAADPLAAVQDMLDGLAEQPSLQALCEAGARSVRRVLGYDRVMVYRFMPDDSGWVVAESRRDDLVPFLDLHYPATDIPVQARTLYLTSWLRMITEVDYTPAPLIPPLNPLTGEPLDMSHAMLRDVSPVHREYLRNMGVDASMSISIVCEGKLWGLIACHHYSPKRLPRHLRAVAELFGAMFSMQLEARQRAIQLEQRLANRAILQQLMRNLALDDDYAAGLMRQASLLLNYIQGGGLSLRGDLQGGVVVRVRSEVKSTGATPTQSQITALADWLTEQMRDNDGIFITDRLSELWPPAAAFADIGSGLLAISVSRESRDFILWFRPELIETVTWAGDPSKPVEMHQDDERLTPRKSFAAWKQTVRGRSSPWSPPDSDAAFDLRLSLLEVVLRRIDAVTSERARVYERDQLLMAELDHRVKNTLANIQALVVQTSRSATSLTGFVEDLDGRIRAMAKAHSLLTQSNWEGVSVAKLVGDELDAYGRGGAELSVEGPSVVLVPKASLALSLAVHELATNAAKYGALSVAGGHVSVDWHCLENHDLRLVWREQGGPLVVAPSRRGFGSRLIERALSLETAGRSEIRFERAGVVCEITLPAAAILRLDAHAEDSGTPLRLAATNDIVAPSRPRILVVEDTALIVMTLEMMFDDAGWEMVGPASTVAEAAALANDPSLDAALLDVNLGGEAVWPIAAMLKSAGVPIVFATGYDSTTVLPDEFEGMPVIGKPFRLDEVAERLKSIMKDRNV
ncbi:HWE histidine kinase domain-containing protein [Glacieibacterium sp.]|uniref:HWE histidine kinase domain-containing protein n=1 Tax=Glacieibacterium sp. TaxID=2860237 RepID=UPI003AFFA30D